MSKRMVAEFLGVVVALATAIAVFGPPDILNRSSADAGPVADQPMERLMEQLKVADSLAEIRRADEAIEAYLAIYETPGGGIGGRMAEIRINAALGIAKVHLQRSLTLSQAGRNIEARPEASTAAEWFQMVMAMPQAPDDMRQLAENGYQVALQAAGCLGRSTSEMGCGGG